MTLIVLSRPRWTSDSVLLRAGRCVVRPLCGRNLRVVETARAGARRGAAFSGEETEHTLLIMKEAAFVALSLASAMPETKSRSTGSRERFSIRRTDYREILRAEVLTSSMGIFLGTPLRTTLISRSSLREYVWKA
ncbi:hypothetical protein EVAR_11128_1 [Eumeta japonica]|uniref:Uncharacterized protein n=1 Tax=Eumeta variegata TaxID=151549 RepID=A0A4C1U4P7_EUMVA|nr:hypothetical protein EVAR_11128_1 [Eumeta japonica]